MSAEGMGFEPTSHGKRHALAVRPGEPYPATFRVHPLTSQVESRGIEPRLPPCRGGVFPLDHDPMSGAPGSRTPIAWVQAKRLPVRPASRLLSVSFAREVRSGLEPDLPPYQGSVQPQHLQTNLFQVTEVGVEPTKSLGSRPNRFANLRTRPLTQVATSGVAPDAPSLIRPR